MKLYVVTQGSYSDYQIRGIFDDEEKAKAFMNLLGDVDRAIEVWKLNKTPSWVQRGKACFRVIIYPPDLKGSCCTRVENMEYEEDIENVENVPIEVESSEFDGGTYKGLLYRVEPIWANSWEAAAKIASEKRAEHIASGGR